jgi:hypothetical protein
LQQCFQTCIFQWNKCEIDPWAAHHILRETLTAKLWWRQSY